VPRLDPQILLRFQRGDHEAFRAIVEHHQDKLYGLAYSILGSKEDAEDILQEAFLCAFIARENFRGQAGFGTWLYRIVFNLCVDLKRRQSHANAEPYDDSQKQAAYQWGGSLKDPLHELEDAEAVQVIRRALDDLTIEQRAALTLREIEGMSYKEIAKIMGCSAGTVMSRLHYGRKRLQERLKFFRK
jgi:RNA polymerase sigma-70 factor (ECF subfamily)